MVSINIIGAGSDKILAACDKELLGQTFSEGEAHINVREDFYGGEVVELEVFAEKLEKAPIANLVGERVVGKAIALGLVVESSVIRIQDVPHAQVLRI